MFVLVVLRIEVLCIVCMCTRMLCGGKGSYCEVANAGVINSHTKNFHVIDSSLRVGETPKRILTFLLVIKYQKDPSFYSMRERKKTDNQYYLCLIQILLSNTLPLPIIKYTSN